MRLVGTVVAAMIALTMVLMVGGAAATFVRPGPAPVSGPTPQLLTYTVTLASEPDLPGPPAMLTPFFSFAHTGLVQIHFVNLDRTPHAFLLTGSGVQVNPVAFSSVTVVVYLAHGGAYTWISLLAYPGAPVGAPVGVLIVS
ncbi:MAG: hypothetical protein L3J73_01115 [Thermoplasmata archaeon]|nr:hypothetical protein [Thermoplasmata archaeon]